MSDRVFFAIVIVFAVLFGVVVLWLALCAQRRALDKLGLGGLGWRQAQRALKRVNRGPVPTDPAEWENATRLVAQQLVTRRRLNRWAVPLFAVLAALQGVLLVLDAVLDDGPGVTQILNVIVPLLLLVTVIWERRRLTRRLAELESAPPAEAPVPGEIPAP